MNCARYTPPDSPWEGRSEWRGASSPSSSDLFPVRILGAGSIGLLYSSALNRAFYHERQPHDAWRNPVTLLVRSHHRSHVSFHRKWSQFVAPVTVTGPTEGVVSKYDTPVEFVDDYGGRSPIRRLLLCTKANDAVAALESVWDRLISEGVAQFQGRNSKVIVLCNGALAVRDAIHEHFGDDVATPGMPSEGRRVEIALATTTHGAYRTNQSASEESAGRYDIIHAGLGSTHSTDEEFIQVCQSIGARPRSRKRLRTRWQAETLSDWDMNMMLWRKLAVNCVINPLTAIHGVKNGQLLGMQHGGQDVKVVTNRIVEEVSRVALLSMEAHVANNQSSNSNDAFLQSAREQLSVPSLEAFVFQVMADTSNNISSMLQDVRAKRRTEVRYLNGYVAALGRDRFGADCPWNDEMCRLVECIKI